MLQNSAAYWDWEWNMASSITLPAAFNFSKPSLPKLGCTGTCSEIYLDLNDLYVSDSFMLGYKACNTILELSFYLAFSRRAIKILPLSVGHIVVSLYVHMKAITR